MRRLRVPAVALGVLFAAAAAFAVPTVWGKPWSIDHFFVRVLARFLLDSPMLLSQLRVLEPLGLHFHSDDLDDFSVAHARSRVRMVGEELAVLRSYDRAALSPGQQRSYDVLEWFLGGLSEGERWILHDYPVNQFEGVQSTLPDFLLNIHQINDVRDARDYVARLGKLDVALDQALDGVRVRRDHGVVPPRFVLDRVRGEVAGFIASPPAEHTLVRHLEDALAGLPEVAPADAASLVGAARDAVEARVYPAYRRLDALLEELQADATSEAGVWRLPDGDAYYAWQLRQHTTTQLSADEIHRLGLSETARIQAEIRAILAAEGLPHEPVGEALETLHADPRFLYRDDDAGRAAILADYQRIVDDAVTRLPRYFGTLPHAKVVVERVPAFKENGAAGAYYRPGPMDDSRPGVFYVNLRHVDETVRFDMRTLAYHEAVPGHHLQISLARENEALPFFRRLLPFGAFSEGWALYAERMAAEEGFHPTPLDRVGQLVAELFRAVRLVVDTGMHARRWSREEAIAYMRAQTGMPETDVVAEIERYIVLPGQACAYKTGQLEILRLRRRARDALGAGFDLRAFHDIVLGEGSLPLAVLERVVDEWLEREARTRRPPAAQRTAPRTARLRSTNSGARSRPWYARHGS